MAEYIDREQALEALCIGCLDGCSKHCAEYTRLKSVPSADVRENVHGKWINSKGKPVPWDEMNANCPCDSSYCSVCGEWLTASDEYPVIGNFCPNCGADMRCKDGNNN